MHTKLTMDEIRYRFGKSTPQRMSRRDAAGFVTKHFFKASYKAAQFWPLPQRMIHGKAYVDTVDVVEYARLKVESALPHMNPNCATAATAA